MGSSLFWNYAGTIMLYTLIAIGVVYGLFLYLKHNPSVLNHPMLRRYRGQGQQRGLAFQETQSKNKAKGAGLLAFLGFNMTASQNSVHSEQTFSIESTLHLEPQKSLYVIRCEDERFLISSSEQGIQLLTQLKNSTETVTSEAPEKELEEKLLKTENNPSQPPHLDLAQGFVSALLEQERDPAHG